MLTPVSSLHTILQAKQPNAAIGDWWALYDAGLDTVRTWDRTYRHIWPGAHWLRVSLASGHSDYADMLCRNGISLSGAVFCQGAPQLIASLLLVSPAEEKWRLREAEEYAKEKAARRVRRTAAASGAPPVCEPSLSPVWTNEESSAAAAAANRAHCLAQHSPAHALCRTTQAAMITEVPQSDVAFLFPGQGSQARPGPQSGLSAAHGTGMTFHRIGF